MPFGFHNKCRFCYEQKLVKTEPQSFDWLRKLLCIGTYHCQHCFDIFRRPIFPGVIAILFWGCAYVATYAVVADPVALVAHEWPDDRALVNQQLIFAPLMKLDPRVSEAKLHQSHYTQPVETMAEQPAGTAIR